MDLYKKGLDLNKSYPTQQRELEFRAKVLDLNVEIVRWPARVNSRKDSLEFYFQISYIFSRCLQRSLSHLESISLSTQHIFLSNIAKALTGIVELPILSIKICFIITNLTVKMSLIIYNTVQFKENEIWFFLTTISASFHSKD